MRKMCFLFLVLASKVSLAQFSGKETADKALFNISYLRNFAIGDYRTRLKSDYVVSSASGLSFSYLKSPKYKQAQETSVFVGGEFGFSSKIQNDFKYYPAAGSFYMSHREMWLNAMMRFRPLNVPKRISPYAEAFIGPKFYQARMMENFDQDQTKLVEAFKSKSLNLGLNVGVGYRLTATNRGAATYLDLGISYAKSNPIKLVDRNNTGLDADYNVLATKKLYNPQNLVLKIGITSFL